MTTIIKNCKKCEHKIFTSKCNTCGKESEEDTCFPIVLSFHYGDVKDMDTYDFCSRKCFYTWVNKEKNGDK